MLEPSAAKLLVAEAAAVRLTGAFELPAACRRTGPAAAAVRRAVASKLPVAKLGVQQNASVLSLAVCAC
jgi:hypothetical protein